MPEITKINFVKKSRKKIFLKKIKQKKAFHDPLQKKIKQKKKNFQSLLQTKIQKITKNLKM